MDLDLKTFEKIVAEMEAAQEDLKILTEIQSEFEVKVSQLTLKAISNPKFQLEAESAFYDLQKIDSYIQECQDTIHFCCQALSSPNPN